MTEYVQRQEAALAVGEHWEAERAASEGEAGAD
jgi:hypothetical protein